MIKVSEETIAEILKRYQAGETPTALAREFKVAKSWLRLPAIRLTVLTDN